MFKLRSIAVAASSAALMLATAPSIAQAAPADAVVAYASPPPHIRAVAQVEAHICRRPWDAPATEAQALAALKARAGGLGANGLINVRYDRARTDVHTTCWKRLSVRGEAVIVGD